MLSFRQINDVIGAALDGEQNDINKLRWITTYEPAGLSWEEFSEKLKEANQPETKQTKEEVLSMIEKKMQGVTFVQER
ncbi:MAG: hypothetical protein J6N15_04220 [Ruminiclostridium sp.]|nr:hypothetical protein [Ruminiclostridium sp.]